MNMTRCKVFFQNHTHLKWLVAGAAMGLLCWPSEQIKWGDLILKHVSGFRWQVPVLLLTSIFLALTSWFSKSRIRYSFYEFFQKSQAMAQAKPLRAASALAGASIVAAIGWIAAGSGFALGVTLDGFLLVSALFYCKCGLAIIADALSDRLYRSMEMTV